jgi:dienelactone hydrolase
MTIKDGEFADIPTPTGPMRTYLFGPAARGKYPGVMLYSEIFQITGPIRRTLAMLAGHGYVVAARPLKKANGAKFPIITKVVTSETAVRISMKAGQVSRSNTLLLYPRRP